MFLIRLIYASQISPSTPQEDIAALVEKSKENNDSRDITGVLCYSNEFFLQCLEGSRLQVNQLYDKIVKDSRHFDTTILKYEEIDEREFEDWSMGYIPPAMVSGELVKKYSGEQAFNPYSMTGDRCYKLLKALRDKDLTD